MCVDRLSQLSDNSDGSVEVDTLAEDLEDRSKANTFPFFLISIVIEVHLRNAQPLRQLLQRGLVESDDRQDGLDDVDDGPPVDRRHDVAVEIACCCGICVAREGAQVLESA